MIENAPLSVHAESLRGQLLIAMPGFEDSRFSQTVIYMCAHGSEGAMGLVVNRLMNDLRFGQLMDQLDMSIDADTAKRPVHYGGPVEPERGFVLHSADYLQDSSMRIDETIALTATVDILRAIAQGTGPRSSLIALGYAGWGPGQLDDEIAANGWLHAPADSHLVFGNDMDAKWTGAFGKLGFSPDKLSVHAGRA